MRILGVHVSACIVVGGERRRGKGDISVLSVVRVGMYIKYVALRGYHRAGE